MLYSVSVLDAIYWTHAAVQKIQADSVTKCSLKAGFHSDTSLQDTFYEASENVDIINNLCHQYNFPFDADAVLQFDEDVATEYHSDTAVELISPENCDSKTDESKEDNEAEDNSCNIRISTSREALFAVNDLVNFALASNSASLLDLVYQTRIYSRVLWHLSLIHI